MYLLLIFLISLYGQYNLTSNSYGSAEGNRIRLNYRVRKDLIDNAFESKDFGEEENRKKYAVSEENGVSNRQIAAGFQYEELHEDMKKEMYDGSENEDQNTEDSESEWDFSLKVNKTLFEITKRNGVFENIDDVIVTKGENSQYSEVQRNPEITVKPENEYSRSKLDNQELRYTALHAYSVTTPSQNSITAKGYLKVNDSREDKTSYDYCEENEGIADYEQSNLEVGNNQTTAVYDHNLEAAGILATASLEPGDNHVLSKEEGSTESSGFRTTEDNRDTTEIIGYQDFMFHLQHRRDDASGRVVGGHPINITEMPSYVIVYRLNDQGKTFLCGGNLISLKHVLTAAHCVLDYLKGKKDRFNLHISKPSRILIRVGSNYSYKGGEIVRVKFICVHPDHSYIKGLGTYRDLTVITLKNKVAPSMTVQIAKIHPLLDQQSLENIEGKKCLIAGWGSTQAGLNVNGMPSYELRQTKVSLISPSSCDHFYRASYNVEVSLCALDNNTDSCQGDSGGGMFCEGMLLGVISWGLGCAAGHPGVYARVDNVGDFIVKAIESSGMSYRPKIFQITLFLIICIYI